MCIRTKRPPSNFALENILQSPTCSHMLTAFSTLKISNTHNTTYLTPSTGQPYPCIKSATASASVQSSWCRVRCRCWSDTSEWVGDSAIWCWWHCSHRSHIVLLIGRRSNPAEWRRQDVGEEPRIYLLITSVATTRQWIPVCNCSCKACALKSSAILAAEVF